MADEGEEPVEEGGTVGEVGGGVVVGQTVDDGL